MEHRCTFVDVYEKAGLTEYIEGNSTHPSMKIRLERLKKGYATENLVGNKILIKILGSQRGVQQVVQKQGDERAGQFIEGLFGAFGGSDGKSYAECVDLKQ